MDKLVTNTNPIPRDLRSKIIFYDDTQIQKQNTLINEWTHNEFSHRQIANKIDSRDLIKFPAFHQKNPSGQFKSNDSMVQRILIKPIDILLKEYSNKIQKIKKNLAHISPLDRKQAFIHACNQFNSQHEGNQDINYLNKSIIANYLLEDNAVTFQYKRIQKTNEKKYIILQDTEPQKYQDKRFKSVHVSQIKLKGRNFQHDLDSLQQDYLKKLDPIRTKIDGPKQHANNLLKRLNNIKTEEIYDPKQAVKTISSPKIRKVKQFPTFLNYYDVNLIINISNNLFVKNTINEEQKYQPVFKFYIGQGNNLQYVKQLLKSRQFWVSAQSKDDKDINLVFTQTFKKHFIQQLSLSTAPRVDNNQYSELPSFEGFPLLSETFGFQMKEKISSISMAKYNCNSNPILENHALTLLHLPGVQTIEHSQSIKIYNHIDGAEELDSKKLLLLNLRNYCSQNNYDIDDIVPQSFILSDEKEEFKKSFNNSTNGNIWIVKPSEDTNRGQGIQVMNNYEEIINFVKSNGKSYIIQKYIENPLLYQNRKFDIRCFCLITIINSKKRVYWYNSGYVRTSSKQFDLSNINSKNIHLTNDAIQMKSNDYGKFEKGNKLSLEQFEEYLKQEKKTLEPPILEQLKSLTIKSVISCINKMSLQYQPTFEIFGIDFMIDDQLKPFLIEFNTNPCLEMSCLVLQKVIGKLLQNVIRIVIDPLFPQSNSQPSNQNRIKQDDLVKSNFFEIICGDM